MDTAKINKIAIIAFLFLLVAAVILIFAYYFRKQSPGQIQIDSSKAMLDTTGTGSQELPPGLSEDKNWPAEKAGIKRFQISGVLSKAPYVEEGFTIFEIDTPIGGINKTVKMIASALEDQTGSRIVSLTEVGKIGNDNVPTESNIIPLSEVVDNKKIRENSQIVVQFLFDELEDKLLEYYDDTLLKSGRCSFECLDSLKIIRDNSELSLNSFKYVSGLSGQEGLAIYGFVTTIYVENK